MLRGESFEFGPRDTYSIIHHFGLAAVEKQGIETHALDRQQQFGKWLAGPQARRTINRVTILEGDGQPEIGGTIGKDVEIGGRLGDGSKGLADKDIGNCLLYTSPSPRDGLLSRMPSSA